MFGRRVVGSTRRREASERAQIQRCNLVLLRRRQIINLDQADAHAVFLASGDGGVGTWKERGQDGGFEIILGRYPGSLDGSLLALFPVIVGLQ